MTVDGGKTRAYNPRLAAAVAGRKVRQPVGLNESSDGLKKSLTRLGLSCRTPASRRSNGDVVLKEKRRFNFLRCLLRKENEAD